MKLANLVLFLISASAIAAPGVTKLELATGTPKNKEEMVFSKDKLTVKAGAKVSLTFKNNAAKSMMHNFVLVKPGKAQGVIDASVAAGPDKNWVADSADIIAKTPKLVDGGESSTIEFTAPTEPGDYPYICTFPGHATMKGVLKVTK
jgi:azurin